MEYLEYHSHNLMFGDLLSKNGDPTTKKRRFKDMNDAYELVQTYPNIVCYFYTNSSCSSKEQLVLEYTMSFGVVKDYALESFAIDPQLE